MVKTSTERRAARYARRAQTFDDLVTRNSFLVGTVWPITGSRGDHYEVIMQDAGFTCTCWGFVGHGHCRHIRSVHDRLVEPAPEYRWE